MHQDASMNEDIIAGRLGMLVASLLAKHEPLTKEKVGGREVYSVVLRAREIMDDIQWLAKQVAVEPPDQDRDRDRDQGQDINFAG